MSYVALLVLVSASIPFVLVLHRLNRAHTTCDGVMETPNVSQILGELKADFRERVYPGEVIFV